MKRFLSWVFLIFIYLALSFLLTLEVEYIVYRFINFQSLALWRKILYVLLSGGSIIFTAFLPVVYAFSFAASVCDSINHSKKGTRYICLGVFILFGCVCDVIGSLSDLRNLYGDIIRAVLICPFGILLVRYAKSRKEEYVIQKEEEERLRISALVEERLQKEREKSAAKSGVSEPTRPVRREAEVVYVEAANGMLARIPIDRLEQWQKRQNEIRQQMKDGTYQPNVELKEKLLAEFENGARRHRATQEGAEADNVDPSP